MPRSASESPSPRLQREADRWLLKIKSGQATARDVAALRHWRSLSPAHALAFDRARQAWDALGAVGEAWRVMGPTAAATPAPRPARRLFLGAGLALAGTAAAAAAVYPPLGLWPSLQELRADLRTGPGERRRVELAGGSWLELNTRTAAGHQAAPGEERVTLIAGELIAVGPRLPGGPAIGVRTGEVRVMLARGAADGDADAVAEAPQMQVRLAEDGVYVTCLAGAVELHHPAGLARLRPRERLRFTPQGLGDAQVVDIERLSAWRHGVLMFRDTPLAEAVDEINRYRAGRVVVMNEALARRRLSGTFRIERLDEVFDQLQAALGARVRRMPGGLVLLG
jgi:transmembrane sensor